MDTHREPHCIQSIDNLQVDKHLPDHDRSVHCEADEFGFIEVLGYVSRFNSVQRAHCDQKIVKAHRTRNAQGGGIADQNDLVPAGIVQHRVSWLFDQREGENADLNTNQKTTDHHLRRRAHKARLLGHDAFFGAG